MAQRKRVDISVMPGTNPIPDSTELDTLHWTETQLCRFFGGKLRKMGGWQSLSSSTSNVTLLGGVRTIYTYTSLSKDRIMIGSNTRLYVYQDGGLYNITPLIYARSTLGSNPISVTNLSTTVTITSTAHGMSIGNVVTLYNVSGAVGGIPQAELNGTHTVVSVPTTDTYTFTTSSAASSTTTGGGTTIQEVRPTVVTAAASAATNYTTLGADPLATTNGSKTVTVTHTAHHLVAGDTITFAGATTTNGIPDTEINASHVVRSIVDANSFTIIVPTTAATSTGSGGGAGVIEKTKVLTITKNSHGMQNGDRIRIFGSAAVGGIGATEINIEHILRGVTTNTFDVLTATQATSSATGGGGANLTYQKQLADGELDASQGYGYSGGNYSVGNYGTGKTFSVQQNFPRIWAIDRYGDDIVLTPGNDGFVYIWQNSTSTAPIPLANSPTARWLYVHQNMVVVLGADSSLNRFQNSDRNDATDWTEGADSYAYSDDVEGIYKFISHARTNGIDLLFTESEVFTNEYVDKPDIWLLKELTNIDGIISPRARGAVDNLIFWMGQENFYLYEGGRVIPLSSIDQNGRRTDTAVNYFFDNINFTQRFKIHCRVYPKLNEIWWFAPFGSSMEPNYYIIYNYVEQHWTTGNLARTASEEPQTIWQTPLMANATSESVAGSIYKHEIGTDADGSAMTWYAETNYQQIAEGDNTFHIGRVIPDATQTGNLDITAYTKLYAQDSTERSSSYVVTATTPWVDLRGVHGRQRKYRIGQNALSEDFIMGRFIEEITPGSPR